MCVSSKGIGDAVRVNGGGVLDVGESTMGGPSQKFSMSSSILKLVVVLMVLLCWGGCMDSDEVVGV